MHSPEADLVLRWRTGDRDAFAALIDRHHRAVFGFLRARVLDRSDAEDMAQQVFLRLYESRTRFDSAALVRPWLLGIARNLLQDYVRTVRRRKDVSWTELCLELESVVPTDAASAEDVQARLMERLNELDPSARQAVQMHYGSERRPNDIGLALHRSEGAVRALLSRARRALCGRLGKHR